jgi:hypothetical protein
MRIVKIPEIRTPQELEAGAAKPEAQRFKRKIKLSWEDLILGLALIVIITSWLKGIFTPEQVLGYLGFTTAGGMWGYVSAKESK